MKCTRCGEMIPANSQFCLRCGNPVAPAARPGSPSGPAGAPTSLPGALPTTLPTGLPGSTPTGGAWNTTPGRPAPGASPQTKTVRVIFFALLILAIALLAATAAVLHSRQNLAAGNASPSSGAGLANVPSNGANGSGMANGTAPTMTGAGLANAPSQPMTGAGMANLPTQPANGAGMANQPSNAGPSTAQPMDNVCPYLQALKQIEAQRQQVYNNFNQKFGAAFGDVTGGDHVGNADAASAHLLTEIIKADDPVEAIQKNAAALFPAIQMLQQSHMQLVAEVDHLQQSPGVPPSCQNLQGYYRQALGAFVQMANAEGGAVSDINKTAIQNYDSPSSQSVSDLVTMLPKLMSAIQEESTRLTEADQALGEVLRTHNVQPGSDCYFTIENTEGGGGGGSIMSAPFMPGRQ